MTCVTLTGMGVYVTVRLFRNLVSRSAWQRIYLDSQLLLRSWPNPPMGIGRRDIAGVPVVIYTLDVERENGWLVVGDADSKLGDESFELPEDLQLWRSTFAKEEILSTQGDQTTDVIQALAEEDNIVGNRPSRLTCLLGNKTQGLPYHSLIVAVATLIENRLPGVALASGDFGFPEADRACRELTRIFGEHFERPVLLEPARIHARVPQLDAVLLSERHTRRMDPRSAAVLDRLYASQRTDLEAKALVCTDPNELSEGTRMTFTIMGIQLAGLTSSMSPPPNADDRLQIMLRATAEGTKRQGITLTD
ncbi:MAG TPA: hypothetical protein VIV60_17000, partial [Polyangiaceae bacterium]